MAVGVTCVGVPTGLEEGLPMSYRKTITTLSALAASAALAAPAAAHTPSVHGGGSGPVTPSGHASNSGGDSGGGSGGEASNGALESIAQCESGGDPSAVGGSGLYRGKYQFTYETWASVGGSGDPAAASEREQDERAARLLAQSGTSPWPVCG